MGHNNIIYGGIEEFETNYVRDQRETMRKINEAVVLGLPSVVDEDPPLLSSMFTVPKPASENVYRSRPITFGASFNCAGFEVEKWLERFEKFLKKMYWSNATMFIRTDYGEVEIISWRSKMWDLGLLPVDSSVEIPPTTYEWERNRYKPDGHFS